MDLRILPRARELAGTVVQIDHAQQVRGVDSAGVVDVAAVRRGHKTPGTRLVYASNGSAVAYVTGETWEWNGLGDPTNYNITYAREFRYDGAWARYLVRELDPVGSAARSAGVHVGCGYGVPASEVIYTAFGDRVPSFANHRYGYAGASGCQTDDTGRFTFLHVGAMSRSTIVAGPTSHA